MTSRINLTQFSLMQDLTDQLAQEFGFSASAVNRVQIFAQQVCGLQCVMSSKKSRFSAKDKTIFINEKCTSREFTLFVAQQVGRWLLHETVESPIWDRSRSNLKQIQRILSSVKTNNKKKKSILQTREAEQFAIAILIPRFLLQEYSKRYEKIDALAADELAKIFDVPLSLMVYRLQQLMDHWSWKDAVIDSTSLENREVTLRDSGTIFLNHFSSQDNAKNHETNLLRQDPPDMVQMSLLDVTSISNSPMIQGV